MSAVGDARKRNADARLLAATESLEPTPAATPTPGYQRWAEARTHERCLSGEHDDCEGLAWDADEGRVIGCACGCGHHTKGDS